VNEATIRRLLAAAAIAALAPASALADDSSAALGAGGISFTRSADIRMVDELLKISPKRVSIGFTFVNEGLRDLDLITAFPLPDIDTSEYSMSPLGTTLEDPVNFIGFKVAHDGKPVAVNVEQRAFYKGREVTAAVRAAGLPINIVNQAGFRKLEKLTPAQKKALKDAGIAEWESSETAHPLWTVRTRFWWKQHFPAGKPVRLDQSYQPVTGQSLFGDNDLSATTEEGRHYAKHYCIDAATRARAAAMIAAAKKAAPMDGAYIRANVTDYVLMTGNNWKGPIGHFRLVLDKLKPGNLLSLCWDGTLKKTGPTSFEAERNNFAPTRDIHLLVLEPPEKK
jgi:hypothetical protein